LRVDNVMVELLDDISDRFQLADRRPLSVRVRAAQRLRAALLNGLESLLGDARLIGRALGLGQLRRGLFFGLLSELENLLKTKSEYAHYDLLVVVSIC
jgi:hypothetical protein